MNTLRAHGISAVFGILVGPILPVVGVAQDNTDPIYQDRGGYSEGVAPQDQSGGQGLVLTSATLGIAPQSTVTTANADIHFFLPATKTKDDVHIRITDKSGVARYRLDKVGPRDAWTPGNWNNFSWSSGVLRTAAVDVKQLDELAYLARLGTAEASSDETVAPVAIADIPQGTSSPYSLRVCANMSVFLSHQVLAGGTPIEKKVDDDTLMQGRCLDLPISSDKLVAGQEVTVQFKASIIDSGAPLNLTVRFVHQPR
jgi:hypothetical protein